MISYTVRCSFDDQDVANEWLGWLRDKHIRDVLEAGAVSAQIVAMDDPVLTYEIRYCFASRSVFDTYIADHAPRLRDEGLDRFPLELGLTYSRSVGLIVESFD